MDGDVCGSFKSSVSPNSKQHGTRTCKRHAEAEAEQTTKPTQLLLSDTREHESTDDDIDRQAKSAAAMLTLCRVARI